MPIAKQSSVGTHSDRRSQRFICGKLQCCLKALKQLEFPSKRVFIELVGPIDPWARAKVALGAWAVALATEGEGPERGRLRSILYRREFGSSGWKPVLRRHASEPPSAPSRHLTLPDFSRLRERNQTTGVDPHQPSAWLHGDAVNAHMVRHTKQPARAEWRLD
jgi:hypothetical protein